MFNKLVKRNNRNGFGMLPICPTREIQFPSILCPRMKRKNSDLWSIQGKKRLNSIEGESWFEQLPPEVFFELLEWIGPRELCRVSFIPNTQD